MIALRQSVPSDAYALVQIWRNAVDSSHGFLAPDDRVAIDPLVADYVGSADLVVAMLDGSPVGFMGMTEGAIDSLFIDPRAQGRGIGRLLVEQALRPCTVDVNEQNDVAVRFYRHLGFEVTGRSELDMEGRPYPLLHMRRA